MRRWIKFLFVTAVAVLSSCRDRFDGDYVHVQHGVTGCVAHCDAWSMNLVGMVQIGEHGDACICAVPGEHPSIPQVAAAVAVDAGSLPSTPLP